MHETGDMFINHIQVHKTIKCFLKIIDFDIKTYLKSMASISDKFETVITFFKEIDVL